MNWTCGICCQQPKNLPSSGCPERINVKPVPSAWTIDIWDTPLLEPVIAKAVFLFSLNIKLLWAHLELEVLIQCPAYVCYGISFLEVRAQDYVPKCSSGLLLMPGSVVHCQRSLPCPLFWIPCPLLFWRELVSPTAKFWCHHCSWQFEIEQSCLWCVIRFKEWPYVQTKKYKHLLIRYIVKAVHFVPRSLPALYSLYNCCKKLIVKYIQYIYGSRRIVQVVLYAVMVHTVPSWADLG